MAMDVGGASGGVKSDINVTPLVDVMLVLLIIMMIVAPMLQQGVTLNMPTASNTEDKPDAGDPTVVFVDAQNQFYINALPFSEVELPAQLTATLADAAERTVYLKGDKDAQYGAIMTMMDVLRKAGIETVGLITERPGAGVDSAGQE